MISANSGPSSPRNRSLLRRVFKWLIVSVALIIAAGVIFQFSMEVWESHRYPALGKLVDIGGLRLHTNCSGVGRPGGFLEACSNDSSVILRPSQPRNSQISPFLSC